MSNLSKANLDKMNKETLIAQVLELQEKVDSMSNEPLTSSIIVKKQISLAEQANRMETDLAKIAADRDVAIEKIRKEAELEQSVKVSALLDEYKTLGEQIKDTEAAFVSSIATTEAEAKATLSEIASRITSAEAEMLEKTNALMNQVATERANSESAIANIKQDHKRVLEDLAFEQKRALAQSNLAYANDAAKKAGMVLVSEADYIAMKESKPKEEADVAAKVEEAVKAAQAKLHAQYNGEIKDLKHAAEMTKTQLEGQVSSLAAQFSATQAREKVLSDQVARIPAVITEAVSAAKAEVNVNQEATKK